MSGRLLPASPGISSIASLVYGSSSASLRSASVRPPNVARSATMLSASGRPSHSSTILPTASGSARARSTPTSALKSSLASAAGNAPTGTRWAPSRTVRPQPAPARHQDDAPVARRQGSYLVYVSGVVEDDQAATLEETARYPVGAHTCPTHLTRTGTTPWFGYGCETDWQGKIGKLETATDDPTVELDQQGETSFQRAPLIASASAATGPVIAGQLTLSLSNVHVYAVESGGLDPGANGEVVGSNLADVSVSPDGKTMLTASKSRHHVEAFETSSLAQRGAYAVDGHPNAVAPSADDTYLAAAAETSGEDDVRSTPTAARTRCAPSTCTVTKSWRTAGSSGRRT